MMKRVLLVISGSIAAYKTLDLIRLLRARNTQVTAILTEGGSKFITPLAVSSLSGTPTYTDLFSLKDEMEMGHIRLVREHDLVVVAPASADLIAKMASGLADDLATAALLAASVPVMIAPAMNHRMWAHKATQRNIAHLKSDGVMIIPPVEGDMACGEYGMGRMAEPEVIAAHIQGFSTYSSPPAETAEIEHSILLDKKPLTGRTALVTSGPTQERIDPVRFISNRSSGKQGHAIAAALAQAGADVTLISGPVTEPAPKGVKVISVTTAHEMLRATLKNLPADIAVCAAAVADWTVERPSEEKMKKTSSRAAQLKLTQTEDILTTLSQHTDRPALVIGFAAETENLLQNAQKKLAKKKCDWILANNVSGGAVFDAEETKLTLLKGKKTDAWGTLSKEEAARKIVEHIAQHFDTFAAKPKAELPMHALQQLPTASAKARALAANGMSKADIARKLNINYAHVANALASSKQKDKARALEHGILAASSDKEKMRFLRAQGYTAARIAKKLDMSLEDVKSTMKTMRTRRKKRNAAKSQASFTPASHVSAAEKRLSQHPAVAPQALEDIRTDPSFPTQTARIRHLATLGLSRSEIAAALNIRYQTVYNVLHMGQSVRATKKPSHGGRA